MNFGKLDQRPFDRFAGLPFARFAALVFFFGALRRLRARACGVWPRGISKDIQADAGAADLFQARVFDDLVLAAARLWEQE